MAWFHFHFQTIGFHFELHDFDLETGKDLQLDEVGGMLPEITPDFHVPFRRLLGTNKLHNRPGRKHGVLGVVGENLGVVGENL